MKTIMPVSFLCLVVLSLAPITASGQYGPVVKLFQNERYRGDYITVDYSWSALDANDPWNDAIESIRIPEGWEVWAYEHSYFRGDRMVLTHNWNGRRNRRWKGRISSVKVVKRSPYSEADGHNQGHFDRVPVTIFEDDNFDGAARRVLWEWTASRGEEYWNDRISSIYVPEGFRVVVYEHSYFRGRSMVLNKSWSAPRGENWWNDQISSLRVERR